MEFHNGAMDAAEYAAVEALLARCGLKYRAEQGAYTLRCYDYDETLIGTGSLCGRVIKYVAVDDQYAGEGAAAAIVSRLITYAALRGDTHLFLYTKPNNLRLFGSLGFYAIAQTPDMLMMENRRTGISDYVASLPKAAGMVGAAVINANPFTNGHLSLIRRACAMCDALYVFVVSEDASEFPADARFELVSRGTEGIDGIMLCHSEDYIISAATFPDYFIKDTARTDDIRADMDITLFAQRIAKPLGITRRFVGSEPFSRFTGEYNRRLKALLPDFGIELIEFPRTNGVSASRVRQLMAEGRLDDIRPLVPESTFEYIQSHIS